jgi:hypothetical protein
MASYSRLTNSETGADADAPPTPDRPDELETLREENGRLRELVVRLSSLVLKTIADRK